MCINYVFGPNRKSYLFQEVENEKFDSIFKKALIQFIKKRIYTTRRTQIFQQKFFFAFFSKH